MVAGRFPAPSTGNSPSSIRSTLAAAPQRATALAAKAAVFAAVAFTAGLAASLTAFAAGQAIFARQGIHMHPPAPGRYGRCSAPPCT